MNFSEFLKQRRTQKNIKTTKAHYEELGGAKTLGISLRHFWLIESGKYPPSEKLLAIVFQATPGSDRKTLILSYFTSVYEDSPQGAILLRYLDEHMFPGPDTAQVGLWDSLPSPAMYSEEQLDFLIKNPDAMRFFHRVLLMEACPASDCQLPTYKLRQLQKLGLIRVSSDAKTIQSGERGYRIPLYSTSSPRVVAKASDYIMKEIELFISREGSPNQNLSCTTQMVHPAAANRVLEQTQAFSRWIKSLAVSEPSPDDVPVVHVNFAKRLEAREL
jgi:hypothetical protein